VAAGTYGPERPAIFIDDTRAVCKVSECNGPGEGVVVAGVAGDADLTGETASVLADRRAAVAARRTVAAA